MPTVSDVIIAGKTNTAVTAVAVVTPDGGAPVTARGFCWNTTGAPDLNDHVVVEGSNIGIFTDSITGLTEGITYYIRSYATNSVGTAYSLKVTQFKVCLPQFMAHHVAGLNGAPVDKVVTYHSVSATYSGAARCWLTQNLGADHQAAGVDDATESSAGWYWQFNRMQGYKSDETTRIPSTSWSNIDENSDWKPENDPCNRMLGGGWRIPTSTEYANVITNGGILFSSSLKYHYSGYLNKTNGSLLGRNTYGLFWSSSATTNTVAAFLQLNYGNSTLYLNDVNSKSYGITLRCLRDTIVVSTPSVSNVTFSTMTTSSVDVSAIVSPDGGAPVTERGFCWNTTGNPAISDKKIASGADVGNFTATISGGLVEGPTYYVKAYAKNSIGIAYGAVNSFKICPATFIVQHVAGFNGAPVSKTVTYHSVSATYSGAAKCWITQNLGAEHQATSATDATEPSAGWYWQFNLIQGYQFTTVGTPSTWVSTINENSDWLSANDPCNLLLGNNWRIPTNLEWTTANGSPQNWNNSADAYSSMLKLHSAGYLYNGALTNRGANGAYWGTTQSSVAKGGSLQFGGSYSLVPSDIKNYGFSLRCLRDTITYSTPSVSYVALTTITSTSTGVSASVTPDGGAPVTDRGFCWNTTGNPIISDHPMPMGSGLGTFNATLTGLIEGITYYVRAYATNSIGTSYSPVCTLYTQFNITGGAQATETTDGLYTVLKFTTSGTFAVTGSGIVEYMVVAGGGGGGSGAPGAGGPGGGGGGGGYLAGTITVSGSSITVVVGSGGNGGVTSNVAGTNGGNSLLTLGGTTILALGGGKGANGDGYTAVGGILSGTPPVSDCGSGGGAGYNRTGGAGTAGQGNSGGNNGYVTPHYGSGGGGGAGGVGLIGLSNGGGNGGTGVNNDILVTGVNVGYAGGGGGGSYRGGIVGVASSGGGIGGTYTGGGSGNGTPGASYSGGGGGGSDNGFSGCAGGSGIVIIRYIKK